MDSRPLIVDVKRLVRNLAGRYRPKSLERAVEDYLSASGHFEGTDLTPEEYEAVECVAAAGYNPRKALQFFDNSYMADSELDERSIEGIRAVLCRWQDQTCSPDVVLL